MGRWDGTNGFPSSERDTEQRAEARSGSGERNAKSTANAKSGARTDLGGAEWGRVTPGRNRLWAGGGERGGSCGRLPGAQGPELRR